MVSTEISRRCVFRRSSFRASSVNLVRKIVSRILLICSATSPALMASMRRRIESRARSASSYVKFSLCESLFRTSKSSET